VWEAATSFLIQRADHINHAAQDAFSLAFARIECHYFVHHGFLERDQQLLENVGRLRHIPAVIVRAATTSSARCTAPGSCTAPGPRPTSASSTTPATPPSNQARSTSS
jgi:hypothetical protein